MTLLVISLASEKDQLKPDEARFHCKLCGDSTKHHRVVYDRFSGKWRRPIVNMPSSGSLIFRKKTWVCEGCGERVKF